MRDELLKQIDTALVAGMSRFVDGSTLHAVCELLTLKFSILLDSGPGDLPAPEPATNHEL